PNWTERTACWRHRRRIGRPRDEQSHRSSGDEGRRRHGGYRGLAPRNRSRRYQDGHRASGERASGANTAGRRRAWLSDRQSGAEVGNTMAVDVSDGRRSIGALLRDLAEGSATLVRGEVRLAKIEVGAAVSGIGTG